MKENGCVWDLNACRIFCSDFSRSINGSTLHKEAALHASIKDKTYHASIPQRLIEPYNSVPNGIVKVCKSHLPKHKSNTLYIPLLTDVHLSLCWCGGVQKTIQLYVPVSRLFFQCNFSQFKRVHIKEQSREVTAHSKALLWMCQITSSGVVRFQIQRRAMCKILRTLGWLRKYNQQLVTYDTDILQTVDKQRSLNQKLRSYCRKLTVQTQNYELQIYEHSTEQTIQQTHLPEF